MFTYCELVILTLALTLHGQAQAGQIVGGHEAVPHSRPYMVLLEGHKQDGKKTYCGGFLLNEYIVMTAAHCNASFFNVKLGVHNIRNSTGIQQTTVKQSFPHKSYDAKHYLNDMMLLKLSSRAKFNENVKPIELASLSDAKPKSCIVAGWGETEDPYMSDVLMEANVTLIDSEECIKENLYCSEGKSIGSGDSGGPLICENGKAYGVVSHRINLKSNNTIEAFARIAGPRSWIKQLIRDA